MTTIDNHNLRSISISDTIKILSHNIATHFELRFNSWLMAIVMFGIGMILSLNPTALTATPNAPVYFAQMLRWGGQDMWQAVFLVIGTTRLMTLVINGTFPGIWWTPHLRMIGAGVSSIIWLQIAISVALVENPTIGALVYPGIFIFELRNTWRAARETRMSDIHGGSVGDWS